MDGMEYIGLNMPSTLSILNIPPRGNKLLTNIFSAFLTTVDRSIYSCLRLTQVNNICAVRYC